MFFPSSRRERALTLVELITVILVVAVLVVLVAPVASQFKRRLEKSKCINNLKGLHIGMQAYVQDKHSWPQIPIEYKADQKVQAELWIDVLKPYGLTQINWVCPTSQYNLGSPDLNNPDNARLDYTPFPYGRSQQDPFRYSNQPWFIENGDMHGNGNILIFPDGHAEELVDFLKRMKKH